MKSIRFSLAVIYRLMQSCDRSVTFPTGCVLSPLSNAALPQISLTCNPVKAWIRVEEIHWAKSRSFPRPGQSGLRCPTEAPQPASCRAETRPLWAALYVIFSTVYFLN